MRLKKSKTLAYALVFTLILSLSIPGVAANAHPAWGTGDDVISEKTEATAIYYNGDIVTVDENMSYAEAVAVKGDKIIAVGKKSDLMPLAGSKTKEIDLEGKTMLPGFYDAHSHFGATGNSLITAVQLQSPPIGSIKDMDSLLAALSEKLETTKPGEWIIGTGYDDGGLAEGVHPTSKDLDKVSTEIPILITHFSGHNSVANTKAMEIAGITKDTPDPSGGEIGHFADGTPNGQLWETAAALVSKFRPKVTQQDQLDGIALASDVYAAKGVTTANEGAGANFELFKKAIDEDYLKIRTTLWFGSVDDAKKAHDQFPGERATNKYYKELVVLNGLKYFQDGSPQLRTAHMTEPYFTSGEYPEDWVAYPRYTQEELNDLVIETHEAGFNQIYIHGNGDAAIDSIINAYEEVRKPQYRQPADPTDLRHTIIHTQFSREDQFDRMEELNLIPSFLMHHAYYLGDRHWTEYFGPERSARMSATQDAVDRDLPFTLHADTPVFPQDPLMLMWGAVNRLSFTDRPIFTETYNENDRYRSVDQRITPEEALRGITINAAYENAEEDITGSIEEGKRADFVILANNPLKVNKNQIKDIEILATIVGGETVYGEISETDSNAGDQEAGALKDIKGHWAEKNIKELVSKKAIGGYEDNTFRPENKIARAEFTKILVKAYQLENKDGKVFADTKNHWAKDTIATAQSNGIVSGYTATSFGPDDVITREQMAAMVVGAAGLKDSKADLTFKDKAKISAWAVDVVSAASAEGIIGGYEDNTFKPQNNATRAEAASVITRALAK